jgi:hypothetical protein
MASLKRSEIRFIDEVFNMKDGYPLDFSNRTFAEFFEDEFKIDIYADKYSERGTSKANRLRCFIETQDGYLVGKALRRLWEYRTETFVAADVSRALPPAVEIRFFELVGRIEAGFAPPVSLSQRYNLSMSTDDSTPSLMKLFASQLLAHLRPWSRRETRNSQSALYLLVGLSAAMNSSSATL